MWNTPDGRVASEASVHDHQGVIKLRDFASKDQNVFDVKIYLEKTKKSVKMKFFLEMDLHQVKCIFI